MGGLRASAPLEQRSGPSLLGLQTSLSPWRRSERLDTEGPPRFAGGDAAAQEGARWGPGRPPHPAGSLRRSGARRAEAAWRRGRGNRSPSACGRTAPGSHGTPRRAPHRHTQRPRADQSASRTSRRPARLLRWDQWRLGGLVTSTRAPRLRPNGGWAAVMATERLWARGSARLAAVGPPRGSWGAGGGGRRRPWRSAEESAPSSGGRAASTRAKLSSECGACLLYPGSVLATPKTAVCKRDERPRAKPCLGPLLSARCGGGLRGGSVQVEEAWCAGKAVLIAGRGYWAVLQDPSCPLLSSSPNIASFQLFHLRLDGKRGKGQAGGEVEGGGLLHIDP